MPAAAAAISSPTTADQNAPAAAVNVAIVDPTISSGPRVDAAAKPAIIDPAVTELCARLSDTDPCGPDLDLAGDADYLNFFAQTEGVLPTSFFSSDDGKPFDRASVDLRGSVDAIGPLWERSRDLRLLVMRARLLILDRDLGGFAASIAAIAQWLDRFWDDIHPRADGGDFGARVAALGALDLPTVVFPLQYAPLCEGRRIEAVTYRAWMIAVGEVKPRPGEQKHPSAALTEAIADASTGALAATRAQVSMLKASLGRIREIFMTQGCSPGLETLAALVDKLQAFIDPRAAIEERATTPTAQGEELSTASKDRNAGAIGRLAGIARGGATGARGDRRLLQPLGALEPDAASGAPGPSADRQVLLRSHEHPGADPDGQGGVSDRRRPVLRTAGRQAFKAVRSSATIARGARTRQAPLQPPSATALLNTASSRARRRSRCSNRSSDFFDTPSPPARCRCCAIARAHLPSGISWAC